MTVEKHQLLSGRSAQEWDNIHSIVMVCGWALVGLMIPFAVAGAQGVTWSSISAICLGAIGLSSVSWANAGPSPAGRVEQREIAAGYTTRPLPHRPDVDLVDFRTGKVLRRAGELALTRAEYRAAIERARV